MNEERRRHRRIAFEAAATLTFPDGTMAIDAIVLDLSLKGARIRLPAGIKAPDRTDCTLHVRLDETKTSIDMKARIAHLADQDIGLACLAIDLDSVTHLRRLVELNLGEPELLERELSALVAD